jgi:hypothetical protein
MATWQPSRLRRRPIIRRRGSPQKACFARKVTVLFEAAGLDRFGRNFSLDGRLVSIDTEDPEKIFAEISF